MKYTQNEKIMQITEETLIIGVDIASEFHYARAFDCWGVEVAKLLRFGNDSDGFHEFVSLVRKLKQDVARIS